MKAKVTQSAPDINKENDMFESKKTILPIAGKIRPGIKALTAAARKDIPGAQKIYDDGVAVGASFDLIEANLKKANKKFTRRPLTPKNCLAFRVSQDDFDAAGAANAIMDAHGEDRGEGMQLYSFPIMFPSDKISHIFTQKFESWAAGQLNFWSELDAEGNYNCMRTQPLPGGNSRRTFGGRPTEVVKKCDPNTCDIFDNGHCSHTGALYFYVPGCAGVGLIELKFKSIYAAMQIKETLEMVLLGLHRIKGALHGKPIFTVTKTLDNVSRIDNENNKVTRVNQFIIKLSATGLDMTQVFIEEERRALGLAAPEASNAKQLALEKTSEVLAEDSRAINPNETINETEQQSIQRKAIERNEDIAKLRKNLSARADGLDLTVTQLSGWGIGMFGTRAFQDLESLEAISDKLRAAEETGDISEILEWTNKEELIQASQEVATEILTEEKPKAEVKRKAEENQKSEEKPAIDEVKPEDDEAPAEAAAKTARKAGF